MLLKEDRIKERRLKMNMTQEELAAKLGVSKQYLCSVEKGQKKFNAKRMAEFENICQSYGLKPKDDVVQVDSYVDLTDENFLQSETLGMCKNSIVLSRCLFPNYQSNDKYNSFICKTDTMEPTLRKNSCLIIKINENSEIIDNEIYVFKYKNKFFVRRIIDNVKELVLFSDNKKISTITLLKDELTNFSIIGQVVGNFYM